MIDLHHLPGSNLHESRFTLYRAHPITLLPLLFSLLIVCAIPFGGFVALSYAYPEIVASPERLAPFIIVGSLFFLYGLFFLYTLFVDYWLDTFIVTDKRILDIEQRGLFSRIVSELRLYRIQDVTSAVHGMVHTFFDYGDITIQTAGEIERFKFENIHHPNKIAKIILDLAEADRRGQLDVAIEEFGVEKR